MLPLLLVHLAFTLHSAVGIQFTGHSQVTYTDDYGHDNLLVWGGYNVEDRVLHVDINDEVDGIYTEYLEFNSEVYRLNLSDPSAGWEQLAVQSGDSRPPGRVMHTMSLNPNNQEFTIFGGTQCFRFDKMLFGYSLKDVWTFRIDNASWTEVVAQGSYPDPKKACI